MGDSQSRPLTSRSIFNLGLGASLAFMLVAGCTVDTETAPEPVEESADDIINGQIDNGHGAVVAVLGQGACTGTIIHTNPANGIGHVLTAAHCGNPVEVRMGTNYLNPTAVFPVITSQAHPNYDPQSSIFDFRMVRISGVGSSTPVIQAMSPAEDNLGSGTQVRHVGYGKAGPAPGSDNTQKRQILGQLSGVSSQEIYYNQPNGGPCSGDSGGPQLSLGAERVAGVTSHGDQNCASFGVSGRVSAVYDQFIIPFINNAPIGPLDCDGCIASATSGQGACSQQVDNCLNNNQCSSLLQCFNNCGNNQSCLQGCVNQYPQGYQMYLTIFDCVCDTGCVMECANEPICQQGTGASASSAVASASASSNAATAGVGGAGAGAGEPTAGAGADSPVAGGGAGDGYNAGNVTEEDYDGIIVTSSGCSVSPRHGEGTGDEPSSNGWLALMALAGLGLARRRD